MKRLIRKVELRFFEDDANGEYGLAHKNSLDMGFNAFYNGRGIFHDVFEHWFEHEHKYFFGDYGFNVGGEMAAMGATAYYHYCLNVWNRPFRDDHFYYDTIRRENEGTLVDVIGHGGGTQFGYSLECNVPYQKPVDDGELEYQMKKLYENVKATPLYNHDREERERAKQWKDSVTLSKVQRLHRWGYRMAEQMVPDNYQNRNTLSEFINVWDGFCKRNPAEEMQAVHRGITFSLYKEKGGIVSWAADFEKMAGIDEEYDEVQPRLRSDSQRADWYAEAA